MTPCFISAPLAAGKGRTVEENVRRACVLSFYAVEHHRAPICVHPAIMAGAYGNDDDPVHRQRGIDICGSLVESMGMDDGELWVLADVDPGQENVFCFSSGVIRELFAFANCATPSLPLLVKVFTWDDGLAYRFDLSITGVDSLRVLGLSIHKP